MKNKVLLFAVLFVCCFIACLAAKPATASTRNVYGYIFGDPGQMATDVTAVKFTDASTGAVYWADSIRWASYPGAIEYVKYNLPSNHSYYVDVYTIYNYENGKIWCGFYLPPGWTSFKVQPDMHW